MSILDGKTRKDFTFGTTVTKNSATLSVTKNTVVSQVKQTKGYAAQSTLLSTHKGPGGVGTYAFPTVTEMTMKGTQQVPYFQSQEFLKTTADLQKLEEVHQQVAQDFTKKTLPRFLTKWGNKVPSGQVYQVIYQRISVKKTGNDIKVYFNFADKGGEYELASMGAETLLKEGVLKLVEACGVGAFAAMAAVSTLFFALKPTPLGTGDVMTWTNEEILTEIVGILAQIDKEMRVARFKESLQDGTSVQQLQKIKPEQADKTAVVKPVNTLLQHP